MKELEKLPILCDNLICDERGKRARCYLEVGEGQYKKCIKREYWLSFKDRHDNVTRNE